MGPLLCPGFQRAASGPMTSVLEGPQPPALLGALKEQAGLQQSGVSLGPTVEPHMKDS